MKMNPDFFLTESGPALFGNEALSAKLHGEHGSDAARAPGFERELRCEV